MDIERVPDIKSINASELALKSFPVDTIETVGHTFQLGIDENFNWQEMRPYFKDISDFLAQSNRYNAFQKEEAEWRLPVGDTEVAELNRVMVRASADSHMKAGYTIARAMGDEVPVPDDVVKPNRIAFACYCCQLARMYDSRPIITDNGYVGLAPLEAQPGDVVTIFEGARVPYIIRKIGNGSQWVLIGESHVYGIMDGEFMATDPMPQEIILV